MGEGRKMALIPLDMLNRIKGPDLTPIKNPVQTKLVKTMNEMSTILHDDSIPEDVKASRFNNHLNDFSVFSDKFVPPPTPHATPPETSMIPPVPIQHNVFSSLPKTFQGPAHILLNELKNFPDWINWGKNNEVTINGEHLPGSNIVDLIGDVLRSRKTTLPPPHSSTFLEMLANLNVPEEFIKNKMRIIEFRSYKKGEDVAHGRRVDRAIRALTKPSPRKQKFKWSAM